MAVVVFVVVVVVVVVLIVVAVIVRGTMRGLWADGVLGEIGLRGRRRPPGGR